MRRHRSAANVRRLANSLPELPWGPSYNEQRVVEIRRRSHSLPAHDQSTLQQYSFSNPPVDNISHPHSDQMEISSTPTGQSRSPGNLCPNNNSPPLERTEPIPGTNLRCGARRGSGDLEVDRLQLRDEALPPTDGGEQRYHSRASIDDDDPQPLPDSFRLPASHAGITRLVRVQRVAGEEESDDNPYDDDEVQPGDIFGLPSTPSGQNTERTSRRRARAFLSFKRWASEQKPWVETCVEFAVTGSLFHRIMSLIEAPFQPVTIKRNLIKYADFETSNYVTCRPHMLIKKADVEAVPDSDEMEANTCDVCLTQNRQPDITTFEYLPLKRRIAAWYSNETSYNELTAYRESKLRERSQHSNGPETERFYEDYFDGTWFEEISEENGGHASLKNDLFLSLSTDGFQTYENQTYDCWPIMALNHNLPPTKRFLLKNIIPIGYVKGPTEPTRLDTFFTPLIHELSEINADGGMEVDLPDGSSARVRVHILWISADKAARNKIAGLSGQNGKSPCEECEIKGVWCSVSRHYYFPSKVVRSGGIEGSRRQFNVLFDINRLPMRTVASIERVWAKLGEGSVPSNAEKKELSTESGVKPKTLLYRIASVTPFISFPHDSMHHIMNLSKDILELLRGENRHLQRENGGMEDDFVIPLSGWHSIDKEIAKIGSGTCLSGFGPPPRKTSTCRNYKAAECREFFCNYALVLFEGHLKRQYLRGLKNYCMVVDLCRRPTLTLTDLDDLERCSKAFYTHIEKDYFRYDMRRVGIMKSTIHSLLHLRGQVERYGPMTIYNQFWVERQLGAEKSKLNATRLAAESMTENAKLTESFKIFYEDHFASNGESTFAASSSSDCTVHPLPPSDICSLRDPVHRAYSTRQLLRSYLVRTGVPAGVAPHMLTSDILSVYGRLQVPCGDTVLIVGALKAKRHREELTRADWYVAAEYEANNGNDCRDVYYGRILQVLCYSFGPDRRVLLLIDWAEGLRVNDVGEVFCESSISSAFSNPTVEDASIVLNSIGVMEHQGPDFARRTYFMDPQRRANRLLEAGKAGADGILRQLRGRRR